MIYCANCGYSIQDNAAFCPECGQPATNVQNAGSQMPPSEVPKSNPITLGDLEQSTFFQFSKPLFDSIDNGKLFKHPFRWLYIIFSVGCLLFPIYFLIKFIENKIFDFIGIAAIVAWLFIALSGWIGFQLWWNRKAKINRYVEKGDDFLAIPTFSHFIQTLGEFYGMLIAVLGFGFSLSGLLLSTGRGDDRYYDASDIIGLPFIGSEGIWGLILSPVLGFFVLVLFRLWAEFIRALASIANNTKKLK